MRKHYETIVRESDERAARSLEIQVMEGPESPFYGGFRDGNGLVEAKFAIYRITTMLACYLNADSRYHGDRALLARIELGASISISTILRAIPRRRYSLLVYTFIRWARLPVGCENVGMILIKLMEAQPMTAPSSVASAVM